jgi:hypothetical protein
MIYSHIIPFADTSHHSTEPVMSQNSHIGLCIYIYSPTIDTVYEGSIHYCLQLAYDVHWVHANCACSIY